MAYADALIESRQYQEATRLLEDHAKTRPEDYSLWYLIAETQGQAGNISKVHQARAEYYVLIGDFRRAREQLQFALSIESEKPSNGAVVAAVRQRIRDIQALEAELAG
jgi:predicted Zn-dependent protease